MQLERQDDTVWSTSCLHWYSEPVVHVVTFVTQGVPMQLIYGIRGRRGGEGGICTMAQLSHSACVELHISVMTVLFLKLVSE